MGRLRLPILVGLAAALLMAPAFRAAGSPFDEGLLVAFPTRVVAGDLPYRDFETFYGPGEPYLVGGVFRVFGAGLGAERAVGFAFRLLCVLALCMLLRRWGDGPALAGGAIAVCLVAADGVNADNHAAALALALLAIVLLVESRSRPGLAGLGGLAGGCAALFAPELVVAAPVAALPLLVRSRRRARVWFGTGFLAAVVPYLPLALVAGRDRIDRNVHDLLATGPDRRLPVTLGSESGRLAVVLVVTALVLIVATALEARRKGRNAPILLSLLLLALFQVPYGFWRADPKHLLLAGLVPLAVAPAAAAGVVRGRRHVAALGVAAAILAVFASAHFVRGGLSRNAKLVVGRAPSYLVSYHRRDFRLDSRAAAHDLQRAVAAEAALARPGSRLFVGPRDLRRTARNDAFVYYLLPEQRPASFYVELDPVASRAGSGLARDLQTADFLILGRRWDSISEPNASARYGSDAANRVVARLFCRRARFGGYDVLARCRS